MRTETKAEPAKAAPAGIVPRLELPRRMRPLLVEPLSSASDEPFYAKLRVEAERGLLDSGAGKLYLRFQMDPLYKVHWNNLVPPLRVELTPPPGLTLSETSLNGPKVEAEADIDPREFLIDVKKAQEEVGPIEVTAHYFACSDEPARPLLVEPLSSASDEPFYAKLRVEAERGLLDSGAGKLYLRFQMDPLYKVHWNNLVPPLRVELTPPPGLTLSETSLNGPKVEAEADIDPREFLIDVKKAQEEVGPIEVTAHYFACSDEPAWCKPMTQTYRVVLERDRDGGSVFRGRMRDMVKKETKDDKK